MAGQSRQGGFQVLLKRHAVRQLRRQVSGLVQSGIEGEEAGAHAIVKIAGNALAFALPDGDQSAEELPVLLALSAQMGGEVVDPAGEGSELL